MQSSIVLCNLFSPNLSKIKYVLDAADKLLTKHTTEQIFSFIKKDKKKIFGGNCCFESKSDEENLFRKATCCCLINDSVFHPKKVIVICF